MPTKPTKYSGLMLVLLEPEEYKVLRASVAPNELEVVWSEDGALGDFRLTSKDGVTFHGTYKYDTGYPGDTTLLLYRAGDGSIVLFGNWKEHGTGTHGRWLFRLEPEPDRKAKKD